MDKPASECMTPEETAEWFRRSNFWLRSQRDLLRFAPTRFPIYHVIMCRAYVLGNLRGLSGEPLRRLQLDALEAACHLRPSCPGCGRELRRGAAPVASVLTGTGAAGLAPAPGLPPPQTSPAELRELAGSSGVKSRDRTAGGRHVLPKATAGLQTADPRKLEY